MKIEKFQISQLKLSSEADGRLKKLQGVTGITPNLLCRLGFCLSLAEPGNPKSDRSEGVSRAIKQPVLLGGYDPVFLSLLRLRHPDKATNGEQLEILFTEHTHRGIMLLANRISSASDILELAPKSST